MMASIRIFLKGIRHVNDWALRGPTNTLFSSRYKSSALSRKKQLIQFVSFVDHLKIIDPFAMYLFCYNNLSFILHPNMGQELNFLQLHFVFYRCLHFYHSSGTLDGTFLMETMARYEQSL